MPNFDFHSNLSSDEFERFVRDVLEIRDSPLKFRTYKPGKDGGIDFKCTNSSKKIIGQAKLYKNSFSQLEPSLVKELIKVKRLKPARYILATSVGLTPQQIERILTLFEGYILSEEDVLDREQLNKYLGQEKYKCLLKTYSKLLIPDINFLEAFLESTLEFKVNQDIRNKTSEEFHEIERSRRVFVPTTAYQKGLDFLLKNKVIIISGNPGVGKTTLAHMITNYLLASESSKIDFINIKKSDDIYRVFKTEKPQIFFWDDFWGQNFAEAPNEINYYRDFPKLLNHFVNSENHYLIITSREYIIQTICSRQPRELISTIDINKFILKVDDLSDEERARIFLNHLYFSDFEKEYIYDLKYNDETLDRIIHHRNYSPRHIAFFIKYVFTKDFKTENGNNSYIFCHYFLKYLDSPGKFWEGIFEKQSATAQLILIVLLISSDPILITDLKLSFSEIQKLARSVLNLPVHPLEFDNEINALEELFIRTEPIKYSEDILVYFQSPGIKDFLLDYLRTKIDFYGEALISGATFFNQLNFVFTTEPDEINDYDSEIDFYGEKILLNTNLQKQLKEKLTSEFHNLNFSTRGQREFSNEFSTEDLPEDSKYWKLWQLNQFFNIHREENKDIRKFIIQEVLADIYDYEKIHNDKRGKIVSHKSMSEFPWAVNICKSYVSFNKEKLLTAYHKSITFTNEFLYFYEFKKIFPEEFDDYLTKNLVSIRKQIKSTILDDIDYYEWEDLGHELDILFEYEIKEVFNKYGLRMTTSFQNKIAEQYDGSQFSTDLIKGKKVPVEINKEKEKSKQKRKKPKFRKIVNEYVGEEYWTNFNYKSYLKELNIDSSKYKKLIAFKKDNELVDDFFEDEISLSILIDYLKTREVDFDSAFNFYDRIAEYLIQIVNQELKIENVCKLMFFIEQLAFEIYLTDTKTNTSKNISELFTILFANKELNISLLYPLIVRRNNWYEFLNKGILNFFVSMKLIGEPDNEEYFKYLEDVIHNDFSNNLKVFQLLKLATPIRLEKEFIEPIRTKFYNSIHGDSNREVITNFFKFFDISFEFEWNKKKHLFEEVGLCLSEGITEFVLNQLNSDFDIIRLNTYFLKDYYTKENIHEFCINVSAFEELYKRIVKTYKIEKRIHILNQQSHDYIKVNLKEFVINDDNYAAIQNIGMEKYLINVLAGLRKDLP